MAAIKVYNMNGSEVGTMELNDNVFAVEYREPLIHQAVVTRLANERQGTKSTLTRSEVRGGGIKPWRQKGTGRARQGSIRAPQWIKGGVVFAPKSRDFSKKMNASAKKAALLSALSKKVADGEFVVVDELTAASGKTKVAAAFAKAFNFVEMKTSKMEEIAKERGVQDIPVRNKRAFLGKLFVEKNWGVQYNAPSVVVVMDKDDVNVIRAFANVSNIQTLPLAQLSTYEVVANAKVVMTKAAVEKFQEVKA